MSKKKLITVGIVLAAAVITATSALAAGGAYRFADDEKPADGSVQSGAKLERGFGRGLCLDIDVKVTDEQKAEALEQIKAKLDEQVASGIITQEQADQIYASMCDGEFTVSCRPNGDVKRIFGDRPELTDEMKADMLAKLKEKLDALVANGKLTQAEADDMYAKAQNSERVRISVPRERGGMDFELPFRNQIDTGDPT